MGICDLKEISETKISKKSKKKDEEFYFAILNLKFLLEKKLKKTSSITNYLKELFSGKLEKSPYHFSYNFWLNNLLILQKKKIEIIRALKKYLKFGKTSDKLIAANDIYNFAKFVPE